MTQNESRTDWRTGFDRRRFLKTTAVAGAGACGLVSFSGSAGAETTVSGGGDALQTAIDSASSGDRLVVEDSRKYDPIVVDVAVSIETTARPKIQGRNEQLAVSIDSDGVTIDGFDVRNPGGLLGIKVQPGYDDVTIVNNQIRNVGPTGRLGVTGIVVGQGDHDDVRIEGNDIRNLDQETTENSGFPTVNGILFDTGDSAPGTVSNAVVNDNTIRDLESDIAPIGIIVQHATDGMKINDNEITDLRAADETDSDPDDGVDFGFTFAQGINITSPSTSETTVDGNEIRDITSDEVIFGEAVKIDGNSGGVTFSQNEFVAPVGLNNRNGTDDGNRDPSNDPRIDATNNWWSSPKGPEEAAFNQDADGDDRADVVGNVEYEPFLDKPPRPRRRSGRPRRPDRF
jgi:hypothetical protein